MPLVDQVKPAAQSLGVGMYTSLMGTFDIPAPVNYIGSTSVGRSIATVVDRIAPWVLPSPHEPKVPLSVVEVAYQAITQTTVDPSRTLSQFQRTWKKSIFLRGQKTLCTL